MQIQISWLLQKLTDLDLHCLQRQSIYRFSRTRVHNASANFIMLHHTLKVCGYLQQNWTKLTSGSHLPLVNASPLSGLDTIHLENFDADAQIFIGENEKWTNRWKNKQKKASSLSHYTRVIPNICTKVQAPTCRCSSSREIFGRETHAHTDRERERR